MKKVSLIGYGGHGYVVAEIIQLLNYSLIGYFDLINKETNPFNIQYLGKDDAINYNYLIKENISVALGIGNNTIRKNIYNNLKQNKINVELLKHPKATISSLAEINEATVIMASATINPFAKIGKAVICNTGCIIEHECVIGDFTHIAPGAVLAGNVSIGTASFIGANAVIKQGIKIGNNVVIGAGSVVVKDVPDNVMLYGNPAKTKHQ